MKRPWATHNAAEVFHTWWNHDKRGTKGDTMIPKGYHNHPGCTGLANLPLMETIATIEKAQEVLSQIHCPACLSVLAVEEEKDREEAAKEIEWQKARQIYFRKVAHYIQARQQAVKYSGTATWMDDQWGGNLDD